MASSSGAFPIGNLASVFTDTTTSCDPYDDDITYANTDELVLGDSLPSMVE